MDEKIKIGCPTCGSVLTVRQQPGVEKMFVTCPVCKSKRTFTDYRKIIDRDDATMTAAPPKGSQSIGRLTAAGREAAIQLTRGINIIGRRSEGSTASIMFDSPSRRMSREHLIIEVKENGTGAIVHYASLYKEKVNPTYIGQALLEYGDKVILKDGDTIRLPDITLTFTLADDDRTVGV